MAYNFPDAPTVGQVFEKWTWNGEAWVLTGPLSYTAAESDTRYVNVPGDTMTGDLAIDKANPTLLLKKISGGQAVIQGATGSNARWSVRLGNIEAETGSNAGSNFEIVSHTDAGAVVGSKLWINRANGDVSIANNLTTAGNISTTNGSITVGSATVNGGNLFFGSGGTKYITFNGTNYQFLSGGIYASAGAGYFANSVYAGYSSAKTGTYLFGNDGTKYLTCDGTNYAFTSGNLTLAGHLTVNGGNIVATGGDMICYRAGGTGYHFFGNTGTKYLGYDGVNFALLGGNLMHSNGTTSNVTHWFCTAGLAAIHGIGTNGTSINVYSSSGGGTGMYIATNANAWTALSDARLEYKKTARPLTALDKLANIQLYENEVGEEKRLELFAKAQELYLAFPHVVVKGDDNAELKLTSDTALGDERIWGVSYDRLGMVALQAVKELLDKVEKLEARIVQLETT